MEATIPSVLLTMSLSRGLNRHSATLFGVIEDAIVETPTAAGPVRTAYFYFLAVL